MRNFVLKYCFYMNTNIQGDFQICIQCTDFQISVPLKQWVTTIKKVQQKRKKEKILCKQITNFRFRSSHQRCSVKKAVLNYFSIFTGKHLRWSLLLIKLQSFRPATYFQKYCERLIKCLIQFIKVQNVQLFYFLQNFHKMFLGKLSQADP